ncbi:DeoR/GlpR family DNA-binding transcription regulator [Paenibacillus pasadenensis]|nr:DeoR/GlpR family DNA-binding transcription regulator [Paenibacillus pasadenensis]
MNPLRRHETIMEMLLAQREVTVAELSERLQVTGKTVREDLAKLEERGLLARIHGGAVLAQDGQLGILTAKEPLERHHAEKAAIAALALTLVKPGAVIALDGGSTTLEIARLLDNEPLTVVTNDVRIIAELAPKDRIQLVVPGGYRVRNMLAGAEAAQYVRRLNIQTAFLSATGVHPDNGFTIYTGDLLELKRAFVETARAVYAVADHSKFGQSALFTFARLDEATAILTDADADEEATRPLRAAGIAVWNGARPSS